MRRRRRQVNSCRQRRPVPSGHPRPQSTGSAPSGPSEGFGKDVKIVGTNSLKFFRISESFKKRTENELKTNSKLCRKQCNRDAKCAKCRLAHTSRRLWRGRLARGRGSVPLPRAGRSDSWTPMESVGLRQSEMPARQRARRPPHRYLNPTTGSPRP